jgi:hypothetical protein
MAGVAFVGKRRPELGLDNAILDYGELKSCLIHACFFVRILGTAEQAQQSTFNRAPFTRPKSSKLECQEQIRSCIDVDMRIRMSLKSITPSIHTNSTSTHSIRLNSIYPEGS